MDWKGIVYEKKARQETKTAVTPKKKKGFSNRINMSVHLEHDVAYSILKHIQPLSEPKSQSLEYTHNEALCQKSRSLLFELYNIKMDCVCKEKQEEDQTCFLYRSRPWSFRYIPKPGLSYQQRSVRHFQCDLQRFKVLFVSGETIVFEWSQDKRITGYEEWNHDIMVFAMRFYTHGQIHLLYTRSMLAVWSPEGYPVTYETPPSTPSLVSTENIQMLLKKDRVWFFVQGTLLLELVYIHGAEEAVTVNELHSQQRLRLRDLQEFDSFEVSLLHSSFSPSLLVHDDA